MTRPVCLAFAELVFVAVVVEIVAIVVVDGAVAVAVGMAANKVLVATKHITGKKANKNKHNTNNQRVAVVSVLLLIGN